jgi:hypothetical protein
MILRGLVVCTICTILLAAITRTEASSFWQGVSGGATLSTKDIPFRHEQVQPNAVDGEEGDVIYITKRDGRREPLDGNKVRRAIPFSLSLCECVFDSRCMAFLYYCL